MEQGFWVEFGVTAVLSALKASIKNRAKKDSIRPAMLKIASTILALWSDDPDFAVALEARRGYELSKISRDS